MFEKLADKLGKLKEDVENIRGYFEIPEKKKKYNNLKKKTTSPGFWDNNKKARKIMKEFDEVKSEIKLYENLKENINEISTLIELAREENEKSLKEEIEQNLRKLEKEVNKISFRLKMSGKMDKKSAILSIYAGAGGTEACDWVDMLTRMYKQWASQHNYPVDVVEVTPGDEAGLKSITMIIDGEYVYGYLKGEVGVHRLVRISPFDSGDRRHTSFAACDVTPKIEDDIQVNINENDLRIDTYRASGHGGQHVNKTDSAVRITHKPTGIVVQCQDSPSQHTNRKKARMLLRARLYEYEKDRRREATQKKYDQKGEIGWGNQIRSYVFMPYQMVRDHRTGLKVGNIEAVMDGEIDEFIESYLNYKAE
ncbi:MAG: peptide chain release factor 2 [Elusimicrobiota bacterium]